MIISALVKVHRVKIGLAIYSISILAAMLTGHYTLKKVGINFLVMPISPALLLTIPAGLGVVVALSGVERIQRPINARRFTSDAVYLVFVTAVGITVNLTLINFLGITHISDLAVVRNILVTIALGLPWVLLGRTEHSWLLPFTLTLFAAQFGRSSDGFSYPWWATVIDPEGSATQLMMAALLFLGAALLYVLGPGIRNNK